MGDGDADRSKGSFHKHRTIVPNTKDSLDLDAMSRIQWTSGTEIELACNAPAHPVVEQLPSTGQEGTAYLGH